jgi:hypothetical protein
MYMQECSIEVGTPAATHEVIGKLFSFSALGLMQDQGDQTVITKAIGGAMIKDACITSVFNACTPR